MTSWGWPGSIVIRAPAYWLPFVFFLNQRDLIKVLFFNTTLYAAVSTHQLSYYIQDFTCLLNRKWRSCLNDGFPYDGFDIALTDLSRRWMVSEWESNSCQGDGEQSGFCTDQSCKLRLNSKPTLPPCPEDILTIWQSEHSASISLCKLNYGVTHTGCKTSTPVPLCSVLLSQSDSHPASFCLL